MGKQWRPAASLLVLREQLNAEHPGRDTSADGIIGDKRHTTGDHLPNARGVVHAIDVTHDPAHGLDIAQLAEQLRNSRDSRIKYVICNRRIFAGENGPAPWVWRPYDGSDPHTGHLHLSVVSGWISDMTMAWAIGALKEDDMTPEEHAELIELRRVTDQTNAAVMALITGSPTASGSGGRFPATPNAMAGLVDAVADAVIARLDQRA